MANIYKTVDSDDKVEISPKEIHAVIFDFDAVLTKTAELKAKVWKKLFDTYLQQKANEEDKPFDVFDLHDDYIKYLDGKPINDGIESFLKSRDITLPLGTPADSEEEESIYGLVNHKNRLFTEMLENEDIEVYHSTLSFIRELKECGIKVAVVSSSENCDAVLKKVKCLELFDVRIDGREAEKLGIRCKPAPDIFLEAVKQLGLTPDHTAIVEDTIAGVQAGKEGKFRLVIGLKRKGMDEALKENGADVVVATLGAVSIVTNLEEQKHALDYADEILLLAKGKPVVIFIDYDGALSPAVLPPEVPTLPKGMFETLTALKEKFVVGVFSGRSCRELEELVAVDGITYLGDNGLEMFGPDREHFENQEAEKFLPFLESAEIELNQRIGNIEGVLLSRRKYAVVVNYGLAAEDEVSLIEDALDEVHGKYRSLKKLGEKKSYEFQPDIDWDEEKSLISALDHLNLKERKSFILYIGNDENTFEWIQGKGVGISVQKNPHATVANYVLNTPIEVGLFLNQIIEI